MSSAAGASALPSQTLQYGGLAREALESMMDYPSEVMIGNKRYTIPFAAEVPFDEGQIAELEDDIREANEVKMPIVLWKERSTDSLETVIDGAHRVLIASKLGLVSVPIVYRSYASEEEARSDARRLNEHRRQLTPEQQKKLREDRIKRIVALRGEGKSSRVIAAKEGISQAQVWLDLQEAKKAGMSVQPPGGKVMGKDGKARPSVKPRPKYYGALLPFRGLVHAPINEQGVVFLFGMVARELGFIVEAVQSPYPDCDGKREKKPGKWERVRIEFEFRSRNFKDHGHDPEECDLIVCWEHNWPDCPIEVLELRSEIAKLPD